MDDKLIGIIASQEFVQQQGQSKTPEQFVNLTAVIYSNGDVSLDQIKLSELLTRKNLILV